VTEYIGATDRRPSSAQHNWNPDGTVRVDYFRGGRVLETVTYFCSHPANIESLLAMFPGTNRDWLESMTKRGPCSRGEGCTHGDRPIASAAQVARIDKLLGSMGDLLDDR
jgi:hypothetical protein